MSLVTLNEISKSFGQSEVLRGIDLTVEPGEMIAITGISGSGKSTLLNILGLIERPSSGSGTWFGHAQIRPNSRQATQVIQQKISYLFQSFALIDDASVMENLLLAMRYVPQPKADKEISVRDALTKVGLDGFESRRVFELSGGEQQRVATARLLVKPTEVVLADEPTGSLDEGNRDNILDLLADLNQDGKAIVIVTHDQHVAAICHRQIKLVQGQIATRAAPL